MSIFTKDNTEFLAEADKLFDLMPKIPYVKYVGDHMPPDNVRAFKEALRRLFKTHDYMLTSKVRDEFVRVLGIMLIANNVEGARKLFHKATSEKSIRYLVVYIFFGVFLAGFVAMFLM